MAAVRVAAGRSGPVDAMFAARRVASGPGSRNTELKISSTFWGVKTERKKLSLFLSSVLPTDLSLCNESTLDLAFRL